MTDPATWGDTPYDTGSITVANGSTAVVGTGTMWASPTLEPGDLLIAGGMVAYILSIEDDTHLTLAKPWPGADRTDDDAYLIEKSSPDRFYLVRDMAIRRSLLDGLTAQSIIFAVSGDEPDPSLGEEGQYALKTNGGVWKQWLKTGGVWELQSTPVGTNYRGVWDSVTEYVGNDLAVRNGSLYVSKTTNTNKPPESSPDDWDLAASKGDVGPPPTLVGTSTSTVSVGTGNKTFTTQSGIAFSAGQRLRAVSADGSKAVAGPVSSYSSTTLVIAVDSVTGSGSASSWNISVSGEIGPQGDKGDKGNTGDKGDKGDKGDASVVPGPQGVQGIQGPQGVGLDYDASGTFAQRSSYDNQTQGFSFLQTDVAPFRLWVKASNTTADWAGPTYIGGQAATGDFGHITDSILETFDYGHIA